MSYVECTVLTGPNDLSEQEINDLNLLFARFAPHRKRDIDRISLAPLLTRCTIIVTRHTKDGMSMLTSVVTASAKYPSDPSGPGLRIGAIIVHPVFEGNGLERLLVERLITHARETEAGTVDTLCSLHQAEECLFYESLGFSRTHAGTLALRVPSLEPA